MRERRKERRTGGVPRRVCRIIGLANCITGCRMLCSAAQAWRRANGMASLTVSCAPCDEVMCWALGFDTRLGVTLAHLPEQAP